MTENDIAEQRRKKALEERLAEWQRAADGLVFRSQGHMEMANYNIRLIETLIYGEPKTPLRKHHHE